jgi:uncharacterized protein YuzE
MAKDELEIKYDKRANAIYIHLARGGVAYTKQLDNLRYVDFSSDNKPVGIELLCATAVAKVSECPASLRTITFDIYPRQ